MKKLLIQTCTLLLTLLMIVGGSSCQKEEVKRTGFLSAKIDGVNFDARSVVGVSNWLVNGDVYVYGQDASDNGLEIYFKRASIQSGTTYAITGGQVVLSYYTADNKTFTATAGEITVIRIDEAFEATFRFHGQTKANEDVWVSEGKVNVRLEDHQ